MMDFEEMVLHESAHSGLAFRARAYAKGEHDELVQALIGLANASVSGPRFLALGVEARDDQRRVTGIAREDVKSLQALLPRIATRLIEPPLNLGLREVDVDSKCIAVIVVQGCDDPPYLLSRDLSPALHAGRGWVRRGTESQPLVRDDLQRMFERRAHAADRIVDLSIGFPGKILAEEISLPVLPLDAMPSKSAAERLQRMLEGKAQARQVLGRTETQFSRLLHAQVFGSEQAFEAHSDDSLISELEHVGEEHAVSDAHYEFEQRAHKLQLEVRNDSDFDIERASLVLTIMRLAGTGVAERLHRAAGDTADASDLNTGYPLVDSSPQKFVVQTDIGRIPAGRSRSVFREPLRLWLREAAAGKTVLIDYKLQCRDLARPLSGSLRVHVAPARAVAASTAGRSAHTA
jgi:hypothetical protein